jgi:hypothetical protein
MIKRFNNFSEGKDEKDEKEQHYMFFTNIKTINRLTEELLKMDEKEIDSLLTNGHDWACDHVSTSKDDIEEVFNFIKGEMDEKRA